MDKTAYVFLDEGGDLGFTPNSSRWFSLTSVTKYRPFECYNDLIECRYDLLEVGHDIEYFHASENKQFVRNAVFEVIGEYLEKIRIDSILVEKRKTGPALQSTEEFYPRMLGYLLKYVIEGIRRSGATEVIILTDQIPNKKKRKVIVKAIKVNLKYELPSAIPYQIHHHDSKSNVGLQIADYCNWAIFRKWTSADERSYNIIKDSIASEFDIFRTGTRYYYS